MASSTTKSSSGYDSDDFLLSSSTHRFSWDNLLLLEDPGATASAAATNTGANVDHEEDGAIGTKNETPPLDPFVFPDFQQPSSSYMIEDSGGCNDQPHQVDSTTAGNQHNHRRHRRDLENHSATAGPKVARQGDHEDMDSPSSSSAPAHNQSPQHHAGFAIETRSILSTVKQNTAPGSSSSCSSSPACLHPPAAEEDDAHDKQAIMMPAALNSSSASDLPPGVVATTTTTTTNQKEEDGGQQEQEQEPTTFLEAKLDGLEMELTLLQNKEAYNLASERNRAFIESRKLRLMFLRAASFNSYRAAKCLVAWCESKLELFGPHVLGRNIQQDDLCVESKRMLMNGSLQVLPRRDASGRAVVCSLKLDRDCFRTAALGRLMHYMVMDFVDDETTQRKGIVIINALDTICSSSSTSSSAATPTSTHHDNMMSKDEYNNISKCIKVSRVLPIKIDTFHCIINEEEISRQEVEDQPPPAPTSSSSPSAAAAGSTLNRNHNNTPRTVGKNLIFATLQKTMPSKDLNRLQIHGGPLADQMITLSQKYGISTDSLPFNEKGESNRKVRRDGSSSSSSTCVDGHVPTVDGDNVTEKKAEEQPASLDRSNDNSLQHDAAQGAEISSDIPVPLLQVRQVSSDNEATPALVLSAVSTTSRRPGLRKRQTTRAILRPMSHAAHSSSSSSASLLCSSASDEDGSEDEESSYASSSSTSASSASSYSSSPCHRRVARTTTKRGATSFSSSSKKRSSSRGRGDGRTGTSTTAKRQRKNSTIITATTPAEAATPPASARIVPTGNQHQRVIGDHGMIISPTRFDVLHGRGRSFQDHSGNVHLKSIIAEMYEEYNRSPRMVKLAVTEKVVRRIMDDDNGRFLKKNKDNGLWTTVSWEEAREKVAHGFRKKREMDLAKSKRTPAPRRNTAGTTKKRKIDKKC